MALAVLAAGGLRAALPPQLRSGDARWVFVVVVVGLLVILILGDPGRIDRDSASLRLLTGTLIGLISAVNAVAAVRLGVQPDGRLGDQALGEAHDDGRGSHLTGGRNSRGFQGREHLEVDAETGNLIRYEWGTGTG
jgi:hypothetical protein